MRRKNVEKDLHNLWTAKTVRYNRKYRDVKPHKHNALKPKVTLQNTTGRSFTI